MLGRERYTERERERARGERATSAHSPGERKGERKKCVEWSNMSQRVYTCPLSLSYVLWLKLSDRLYFTRTSHSFS